MIPSSVIKHLRTIYLLQHRPLAPKKEGKIKRLGSTLGLYSTSYFVPCPPPSGSNLSSKAVVKYVGRFACLEEYFCC